MVLQERNNCVVRGALAVILRVSRWVGLAPLSFERLRHGGLRATASLPIFVAGCTIFILCRVFLFGMFTYDIVTGNMSLLKMPTMSALLFSASDLMTIFINCLGVFRGIKRIKRLLYILWQMQEVNIQLAYDNSLEPTTWKVWTFLIFYWCALVFLLAFDLLLRPRIDQLWGYTAFLLVETAPMYMLVVQHVFFFLAIKSSVETLNCRVKKLYYDELNGIENQQKKIFSLTKNYRTVDNTTSFPNIDSSDEIEFLINKGNVANISPHARRTLKKLAQNYLTINSVMSQMVELEGGRQFTLTCGHIVFIIVTVFNLYIMLTVTSSTRIPKVLCQCLWLMFHCARLMIGIEPCHRLLAEMEKTKVLLSVLSCKLVDTSHRRELGSFFQQFLLARPSCVPLGICTFNRQLIATIVGAVTSFLIIVIQFKLNEKM